MFAKLPLSLIVLVAVAGFFGTCAWAADIVDTRIQAFKSTKASVGRIDDALSDQRLDQVAEESRKLADFAATIPALFPEGSGEGWRTKANDNIWKNSADFQTKANDFQQAAEALANAAGAGDLEAAKTKFEGLRDTCKACHSRYKGFL